MSQQFEPFFEELLKRHSLESIQGMFDIYNKSCALFVAMQDTMICVTETLDAAGISYPPEYRGHLEEIDQRMAEFMAAKEQHLGKPPLPEMSEEEKRTCEWRETIEPPAPAPDAVKEASLRAVQELRVAGLDCIDKGADLLTALTQLVVAGHVQPKPEHQTLAQEYNGAVTAFQLVAAQHAAAPGTQ